MNPQRRRFCSVWFLTAVVVVQTGVTGYAQGPACDIRPAPSCGVGSDGYFNGSATGGGTYGAGGEPFVDSPFDLGEAGPAQIGDSFAADAPNMIGDSTFGGCGGLFVGGVLAASIPHPIYACSRLNIAENNSPIVRDRVYFTYRHFHNATPLDIFSYSPQGLANDLNIDVFTLAFEKRIALSSIEVRMPINRQFTSSPVFLQGTGGFPDTPASPNVYDRSVNNLDTVLNDVEGSLGNISVIFKRELAQTQTTYISGGIGVNLPTAPDVNISGQIRDQNFPIFDPLNPLAQPGRANVNVGFGGIYRNETVSLQPFLAMVHSPTPDTFFQGFLQVDVPVNASPGEVSIDVVDVAGSGPASRRFAGTLPLQTLLRMNLGAGRWLYRDDDAQYLRAAGVMFEAHYTTTLNDASISTIDPGISLPGNPISVSFGNIANRVDSVNLALGVPLQIGLTTFYNGFVVPVTEFPNRGFNFEYALTVNRAF